MQKAIQLFFGGAMAALIALVPIAAPAQVGTSQADLANYRGAYSIENTTGITVHYEYRWGNKSEWKKMALRSGAIETHTYPLGEDRNKKVPIPYVRFDRIGGDNSVTFQEYKLQFRAVGYAGYGPRENKTEPKRYVFRYAENGRDLDLNAK
jgi:hypothetical protein